MVKFKLLVQFPVDHLAHPVVSILILSFVLIYFIRLLCDWSFRLNCHIIFICYFVASCLFFLWHSPYGVVSCCYQERFSFHLKVSFFSHVQISSCEMSLICGLKYSYSCFSSHFCFLLIFILLMLVLSVLFLLAAIILPPRFLCCVLVVVSMNRRCLQC